MKFLYLSTRLIIFIFFTFCFYNSNSQELWGTTTRGGDYNAGVIFKTDKTGNEIIGVHDFFIENFLAAKPIYTKLLLHKGKFYGTTAGGGSNADGVLFELDPATDKFTTLFEFEGGEMGSSPNSGVIEHEGKLYGTLRMGDSGGRLYEYDIASGNFRILIGVLAPVCGVVELNSRLYGMSHVGGENECECGFVYEYDLDNDTPGEVHHFDGINGGNPIGGLLVYNNKLFGMTVEGGAYGFGVIYEVVPNLDGEGNVINYTFNKLHDFDGTNGAHPYGRLIPSERDGILYGMTAFGGEIQSNSEILPGPGYGYSQDGSGVIFEFELEHNTLTKKFDFGENTGQDGTHPFGDLLLTDNTLFGITAYGGEYDNGVLFEFDLTSGYTKKVDFLNRPTGRNPKGTLAEYGESLYGLTHYGGLAGRGTVFKFNTTNDELIKIRDLNNVGRSVNPSGKLVEVGGKFYGMTVYGGDWSMGMIYEIDPVTEEFTVKHNFDGIGGQWPFGGLLPIDNVLYGVTARGGANDNGALFEYDLLTDTYTKTIDFEAPVTGAGSNCDLVEYAGMIYGLAPGGGSVGKGTLFKYNPTDKSLIVAVYFDGGNGQHPWGGLTILGDHLYGLTKGNQYPVGPAGSVPPDQHGTLFKFSPEDNSLETLFSWNGENGSQPSGNLLAWQDKLYGMTTYGGIAPNEENTGSGIIFEYDPFSTSEAYQIKANFNVPENVLGKNPLGSLMELCGKFYGVTTYGGEFGKGTLFEFDPEINEFDPEINNFDRVLSFNEENGAYPYRVTLVGFGSADVTSVVATPNDPISINSNVTLEVTYADTDNSIELALIDWGDNTQTEVPYPDPTFNVQHTYTSVGVFSVTVTLKDAFCGLNTQVSDINIYKYVVAYNPSDGFVTGGGWIDSPEGAYTLDRSLSGTANFGFVAKYKKGKTVPEGNTEFQFQAGNLNFHSEDFEWLVIAGPKAMFKGVGTINGSGLYGFQVSAIDANLTPSTDVDLFRIRIWDKNNNDELVYDNKVGEVDPNADPTTEITGGSITIHKSDLKNARIEDVPEEFSLTNYPNPFTKSTMIEFSLPDETNVLLRIFNIYGQQIKILSNKSYPAGTHFEKFNGGEFPAGQYLYQIKTADFTQTNKMILHK